MKIKSIPFTKLTYKFLNSEHIKILGDLANVDMSKLIKSKNMTQVIYHVLVELKNLKL